MKISFFLLSFFLSFHFSQASHFSCSHLLDINEEAGFPHTKMTTKDVAKIFFALRKGSNLERYRSFIDVNLLGEEQAQEWNRMKKLFEETIHQQLQRIPLELQIEYKNVLDSANPTDDFYSDMVASCCYSKNNLVKISYHSFFEKHPIRYIWLVHEFSHLIDLGLSYRSFWQFKLRYLGSYRTETRAYQQGYRFMKKAYEHYLSLGMQGIFNRRYPIYLNPREIALLKEHGILRENVLKKWSIHLPEKDDVKDASILNAIVKLCQLPSNISLRTSLSFLSVPEHIYVKAATSSPVYKAQQKFETEIRNKLKKIFPNEDPSQLDFIKGDKPFPNSIRFLLDPVLLMLRWELK